jgi:hypothetical protein
MKKLLIILALSLIVGRATAPPANKELIIFEAEQIKPFERMLIAFEFVESNFNTEVINSLGYGGILQIGQEMIDEVNRICKITNNPSRFVLSDRLNKEKSEEIWYIVQEYWNPHFDIKKACKIWNPLASEKYYLKIKKAIS